jgi:hypothetical protein
VTLGFQPEDVRGAVILRKLVRKQSPPAAAHQATPASAVREKGISWPSF